MYTFSKVPRCKINIQNSFGFYKQYPKNKLRKEYPCTQGTSFSIYNILKKYKKNKRTLKENQVMCERTKIRMMLGFLTELSSRVTFFEFYKLDQGRLSAK